MSDREFSCEYQLFLRAVCILYRVWNFESSFLSFSATGLNFSAGEERGSDMFIVEPLE